MPDPTVATPDPRDVRLAGQLGELLAELDTVDYAVSLLDNGARRRSAETWSRMIRLLATEMSDEVEAHIAGVLP